MAPTSPTRLIVCLALLLLGFPGQALGQNEDKLPEGLREVPPEAMAFVHFRVGDFLGTDLGKSLHQELSKNKEAVRVLKGLEWKLGLTLADLESLTVVVIEPPFFREKPGSAIPMKKPEPRPEFEPFPKKDAGFGKKSDVFDPKPETPKTPDETPKEKKSSQRAPELLQVAHAGNSWPLAIESLTRHAKAQAFRHDHGEHVHFHDPASLFILTTHKPFDRKKILKSLVVPGNEGRHWPNVAPLFLSDRSFMLGRPEVVFHYVEKQGGSNPSGPEKKARPESLKTALALGSQKHLVLAGVQVSLAKRLILGGGFDPLLTILPLLNAEAAALTLDLDKDARLMVQVHGHNERGTALAGQAVKTALALIDLGCDEFLDRQKGISKDLQSSLTQLQRSLAEAKFEQDGKVARVHVRMEVEPATAQAAAKELIARIEQAGNRARSANNLRQIGLALHSYHDVYRSLPGNILDKEGKPILSWRVAILPFIEQGPLFEQFDRTLPWDHPHNKKLIERMPMIYALPTPEPVEHGRTHYLGFVGPGTVFEPVKGGLKLFQIPDGSSNTLMLAEAKEPLIWTKPEDMPYDPKKPLPRLGGHFADGFNLLLCDGSVRFVRSTINEQILRLLITRDDGQVTPPFDD